MKTQKYRYDEFLKPQEEANWNNIQSHRSNCV
jgi:hypothetical protein